MTKETEGGEGRGGRKRRVVTKETPEIVAVC